MSEKINCCLSEILDRKVFSKFIPLKMMYIKSKLWDGELDISISDADVDFVELSTSDITPNLSSLVVGDIIIRNTQGVSLHDLYPVFDRDNIRGKLEQIFYKTEFEGLSSKVREEQEQFLGKLQSGVDFNLVDEEDIRMMQRIFNPYAHLFNGISLMVDSIYKQALNSNAVNVLEEANSLLEKLCRIEDGVSAELIDKMSSSFSERYLTLCRRNECGDSSEVVALFLDFIIKQYGPQDFERIVNSILEFEAFKVQRYYSPNALL